MTTFCETFQGYLDRRTHAPPAFHVHAALACLSQAIGNNMYCPGWSRELFPNLYAVIIAESGSGKSVPLDMTERLLAKAKIQTQLPDSFSFEALVGQICEIPQGIFVIQEFSGFMGTVKRDYNKEVVPLLTELYDVPLTPKKRVTQRGTVTIPPYPFLTVLGASSPDWFIEAFKASDLRGGFLARFVWCPSSDLGPRVKEPGDFDAVTESILVNHLTAIQDAVYERRQKGVKMQRADFSRLGALIDAFDEEQEKRIRLSTDDFRGMRSRGTALAKKVAMLFMLSRDPETTQVSKEDFEIACSYVRQSHHLAETFLGDRVPRNPADAERIRLRSLIRQAGGAIDYAGLLRQSHLDKWEFERAINTLEAGRYITVHDRPGHGFSDRYIRMEISL